MLMLMRQFQIAQGARLSASLSRIDSRGAPNWKVLLSGRRLGATIEQLIRNLLALRGSVEIEENIR
jgi:hypothetical protein